MPLPFCHPRQQTRAQAQASIVRKQRTGYEDPSPVRDGAREGASARRCMMNRRRLLRAAAANQARGIGRDPPCEERQGLEDKAHSIHDKTGPDGQKARRVRSQSSALHFAQPWMSLLLIATSPRRKLEANEIMTQKEQSRLRRCVTWFHACTSCGFYFLFFFLSVFT